jgi:hypothetical protein
MDSFDFFADLRLLLARTDKGKININIKNKKTIPEVDGAFFGESFSTRSL